MLKFWEKEEEKILQKSPDIDILRKIIKEEILNYVNTSPPNLDKLNLASIKQGKKLTVWEGFYLDFSNILLCISGVGPKGEEKFKVYPSANIPELKKFLETFDDPSYKLFKSASLHLEFKDSDTIVGSLVRTKNNEIYYCKQLPAVFKEIIDWIDERPELLL